MTADPETRLRADARRNRDQIITAAKQMFLESGTDVPMEEIARRAAVGVGTLYRRFPDREALIRAVAQDNLALVLAEARASIKEEPTAWDALVRLLGRSRELRLTARLALLSPLVWAVVRSDPKILEFRDEIMVVLDEIVRTAQAEGSLRADVGTGDVAVLCSLLLKQTSIGRRDTPEEILARVAGVIVDGLRAQASTPLPGHPITSEDLRMH